MNRDVSIAWAAGLIEGEGCFLNTGAHSFKIAVSSTDLDVLERLKDIAGGGNLVAQAIRNPKHKPVWVYTLHGGEAAKFLDELSPHLLSRRRERADSVLSRFREHETKKKSTIELRQEILRLWATGKFSEREVGELTGTNRSYVNAVRSGKMKVDVA